MSACAASSAPSARTARDWRVTGGDPGNTRYSPLAQIDRSNVQRLKVAWVYHSGDARADNRSQIQATPIVVDGILYSTTPGLDVVALRAASGEEVWRFDPYKARGAERRDPEVNRGVVYWQDGNDRRILFTQGDHLFALDAATGHPIPEFGSAGSVDLGAGLGRETDGQYLVATSPGVIYHDLLIQGTRVGEARGSLPGFVRAYDVRTGQIRWTFHTIPQPGEFGYETWPAGSYATAGGANSWPGMAVDVQRGIVYVPTGSPTGDFYGGHRVGADLFGNTLIALDAATGRRIWHFQTVHHDLWDRDLPAAPNLLTVTHDGRRTDAVAQITKSGFVFLFDRASGAPLFPVEERPVPPSDLRGEQAWPTQPIPLEPAPFARQTFTEADITDLSPEAHAAVLERFRSLRQPAVLFTPPSEEGSVVFPGFDGGGEWGGAAVDPRSGVLFVNASDVPWIATMVATDTAASTGGSVQSGREVYARVCAGCHGAGRRGDGDRIPSLVNVSQRLSAADVRRVIDHGRGFMPAFADLPDAEKDEVIAYLLGRPEASARTAVHRAQGEPARSAEPYRFKGYERWKGPDGYPAVRPPWGTLNAIDLNTGEYLWKTPLGEFPELTAKGIPPTGTENYGGPIATAGGLVFIGASQDAKFRAFDERTGELLWQADLPAAGYATPCTYEVDGRQYVVIAAGGGKLGTPSGDAYVAFALPD
ncbi:MAG TPA: PQQ-binding-like beta-propeller repeat protein [Longimicrobiaceae bacterium]|nr:PQQ-binding-like beta-propeller repeat protein [Longimicrobiaceae bacterium]